MSCIFKRRTIERSTKFCSGLYIVRELSLDVYSIIAGTGLLPGPISELHANVVDDSTVSLEWEGPTDGSNVTDYVVHYQKVDNTSMHETLLKLDNVSLL